MSNALLVELDARIEKFNSKVDSLNTRLNETSTRGKSAEGAIKRFDLSSIAAGVSVGLLANKLNALSDGFIRSQNLLRNVTDGTQNLADVTDKLFNVAERSRAGFESTATLYARMARATKDLKVSQDELLAITETINKAFVAGGASSQEAAAATIQLSQALASGVLRGDEFNSIAEQAPGILDAVAFATGRARGELRELAADGQITSDVLIKSLQLYQSTIEQQFGRTTETFADKVTAANRELQKFVADSQGIQAVTAIAGDAIKFMANNLETFASVAAGTLFVAAIANVKTLNAVLAANPYMAAASAIGTLTVALSAYLNIAGQKMVDDAKAQVLAQKSVNEMLDEQTKKLGELGQAKEKELALIERGGVAVDKGAAQERVDQIQAEINQVVELIKNLQELQKARGGDFMVGGVEGKAPTPTKGAGTVELGDKQLEAEYELFQQRLAQGEEYNAAVAEREQAALDETLNRIFENDERKMEQLRTFAMTRADFLAEQHINELLMLDEALANGLTSEEDYWAKKRELAEDYFKRLQSLNKSVVKDDKATLRDRAGSLYQWSRTAAAVNETMFNDNKLIKAGTVVADTAAGIMRTVAEMGMPKAIPFIAATAAMGVAQLANVMSASKGGGQISGGGASAAATTITNEPLPRGNISTLQLSANIEGEASGLQVMRLNDDDRDDLAAAIGREVARYARAF